MFIGNGKVLSVAVNDEKTSDVQKQQIIRAHYDKDYYRPLLEGYLNNNRFSRYRLKKVFEMYTPKPNERVLDIGCGVGTFTLELARMGVDVVGLDYSEESISICRRLTQEQNLKAEFVRADATDTKLDSESFDVVLAADLVEHLYPDVFKKLISETKRLLKPGGKLLIWTPNPGHIFEFLKQRNIILKRDEGHIGYKTLKQLKDELSAQGFKIARAYHRESHLPIFNLIERALQWAVPLLRRRNAVLAVK
jgi:2-polyprenyl-3-methyl-5-hydroxy-6-metoxy-1,4-benzoquinol methylase